VNKKGDYRVRRHSYFTVNGRPHGICIVQSFYCGRNGPQTRSSNKRKSDNPEGGTKKDRREDGRFAENRNASQLRDYVIVQLESRNLTPSEEIMLFDEMFEVQSRSFVTLPGSEEIMLFDEMFEVQSRSFVTPHRFCREMPGSEEIVLFNEMAYLQYPAEKMNQMSRKPDRICLSLFKVFVLLFVFVCTISSFCRRNWS
jgi:hypothetical protein